MTPSEQIAGLPTEFSEFVGRTAELAQIEELLATATARLVTLSGPGGIGKTRLAVRAASDLLPTFGDGATFVDLSAATNTAAVVLAMARSFGVADRSELEQLDEISTLLRDQQRLLVLDNFEQAIEAAPAIAKILVECPRVRILATSREPLSIRGEHVFQVQPMGLPAERAASLSVERIASYESVQLFVERARAVRPDFQLTSENAAAVAEICSRLDGLPLAIELATARIAVFSPQKLLERLTSRLDVLKGGARDVPERQRTLRGAIEWSYELLEPAERRLFSVLAVFDGADFDAVEAVVDGLNGKMAGLDLFDGLVSLTNKSLVRQQELDAGGARFSMLETIREYADGQLREEDALADQVRDKHASYFAGLAVTLAARLGGSEREDALEALDVERLNLAGAWRYLVEEGNPERLDALLDPLWMLYEARGWYRAMLEIGADRLAVLARAPNSPDRVRAEVNLRMSMARALLATEGYTSAVEEAYARAFALFGDGEAPGLFPVLRALASFHLYRAEFVKAADIGRRILALAESENDPSMRVEAQLILGANLTFIPDLNGSLDLLEQAIDGLEAHPYRVRSYRAGYDPRVTARTTSAIIQWVVGRIDESRRRADQALEIALQLAHPTSLAYAHHHVGLVHFFRAEPELLRVRAEDMLAIAEADRLEVWRAIGTTMLGVATAGLGRPEEGLARLEEGMTLYGGLRAPPVFWPMLLYMRAWAFGRAGRGHEGLPHLDRAIAEGDGGGPFKGEMHILRGDLLSDGAPNSGAATPDRVAAYELAFQRSSDDRRTHVKAARGDAACPGERPGRRRRVAPTGADRRLSVVRPGSGNCRPGRGARGADRAWRLSLI